VLTRLDACEAALAGGYGEMPAIVHGMLRDLVLAVRDLVSRAWLAAGSDAPDIAAFNALESIPAPPAPADLDEIISRVLWARFAPHRRGSCRRRASAGGSVNPSCRRSGARAAHRVKASAQRPVAAYRAAMLRPARASASPAG